MSSTQLDTLVASLRGLKDASPLGFSFRPVQPLNGRMVTVGYPRAEPTPGAPVAEATLKFAFDYFSASALAQQVQHLYPFPNPLSNSQYMHYSFI